MEIKIEIFEKKDSGTIHPWFWRYSIDAGAVVTTRTFGGFPTEELAGKHARQALNGVPERHEYSMTVIPKAHLEPTAGNLS